MGKFFKTKYNYHDFVIAGYKWEGDNLVIQIDPNGPKAPFVVMFSNVKNKIKLNEDLSELNFSWKGNCNIYSIEKTDDKEFTIHISDPLKIVCDNILEV